MYSLKFEAGPGFLRVVASGKLDATTDREIDERVVEACRRHEVHRALVDIRSMDGRLSVSENFDAAATLPQRLAWSLDRLAVVDLAAHRERSEMFQVAATNRGANIRFFEDPEDAQAWLAEG